MYVHVCVCVCVCVYELHNAPSLLSVCKTRPHATIYHSMCPHTSCIVLMLLYLSASLFLVLYNMNKDCIYFYVAFLGNDFRFVYIVANYFSTRMVER